MHRAAQERRIVRLLCAPASLTRNLQEDSTNNPLSEASRIRRLGGGSFPCVTQLGSRSKRIGVQRVQATGITGLHHPLESIAEPDSSVPSLSSSELLGGSSALLFAAKSSYALSATAMTA